jgi:hypothetical protein
MKRIINTGLLAFLIILTTQCRKNPSPMPTMPICDSAATAPYFIVLHGKLVDCNNNPVTGGAVIINYPGGYPGLATGPVTIACTSSGDFTTNLYYDPFSKQSCQITGLNVSAHQQGSPTTISLASLVSPCDSIGNVGNIIACGGPSMDPVITFSIDGGSDNSLLTSLSTVWAYPNAANYLDSSLTTSYSSIFINGVTNYDYSGPSIGFSFKDDAGTTGTFPLTSLYDLEGFGAVINLVQPFNVNITHFAQTIGDTYEGSFTGHFTSSVDAVTLHTITCTFKQPRTQ